MRRTRHALLSLILLVDCRSVPAIRGKYCAPPPIQSVQAIPTDVLMRLAGNYILTSVATSKGMDGSPEVTHLTLSQADSVERFYEVNVRGHRRTGNRVLIGEHTSPGENGTTASEAVVVQQNTDNSQMIFGFCTLCFDAQWVYYTITDLTPNGFKGRWTDPQTGIGKLVDRKGRELPNPEGYFCADRVS